jgi:hypothetical protein
MWVSLFQVKVRIEEQKEAGENGKGDGEEGRP